MTSPGAGSQSERAGRRLRRVRQMLRDAGKRLPPAQRLKEGLTHAAMSTAAALIAYLPTQALGLREGFWAAITAISVVQSEFGATRTTARDQFVGAAIGGTIGVAVASATGQTLASFAFAAAVSVLSAWLLNVASAARLAGITATIILLVPHPGTSAQHMMLSRISEVSWGVTVAIAIVWLAARLTRRGAGG